MLFYQKETFVQNVKLRHEESFFTEIERMRRRKTAESSNHWQAKSSIIRHDLNAKMRQT